MNLIFDLDSTLISTESLELALEKNLQKLPEKRRAQISKEIAKITAAGMNGEISPLESLRQRISLVKLTPENLKEIAENLPRELFPGAQNLVEKYRARGAEIFIVSGAPEIFVFAIADFLQIPRENCRGCCFEFSSDGNLNFAKIAPDKVSLFDGLKFRDGKKIMIGDGATDLEIFEKNLVDEFVAFAGAARREKVCARAKFVAESFADLEKILKNLEK